MPPTRLSHEPDFVFATRRDIGVTVGRHATCWGIVGHESDSCDSLRTNEGILPRSGVWRFERGTRTYRVEGCQGTAVRWHPLCCVPSVPLVSQLPSGKVTFLFTDIEGSTLRWEQDVETMV